MATSRYRTEQAVEHLFSLPPYTQRIGFNAIVAPRSGSPEEAVAQVRLQLSVGKKVVSQDPASGEVRYELVVTLQQISVLPSARGNRHSVAIMNDLAQTAACHGRRLVIQSVLSDKLKRILHHVAATSLPFETDSFLYHLDN